MSGKLPFDDLEEAGFQQRDSFIWDLKHNDFSVAAIAIPNNNSEPYWVLQVSKRRGKGLPVTACEMATIVQTQQELELPFGEEKAS